MGHNRDLALNHCQPSIELPFSLKEYNDRLRKIKDRMITEKIDLLWLSAPESLFYVSGYTCNEGCVDETTGTAKIDLSKVRLYENADSVLSAQLYFVQKNYINKIFIKFKVIIHMLPIIH